MEEKEGARLKGGCIRDKNRWKSQVWEESNRVEIGEKNGAEKSLKPKVVNSALKDVEVRKEKRGLDEFDLGEIFTTISESMRKEMETVVGKTPSESQRVIEEGLSRIAKVVEDTMSGISDIVKQETKDRKEVEKRTEERLTKLEGKTEDKVQAEDTMSRVSDVVKQERKERKEVEKRTEEWLTKLEEKIEDKVQAVQAEVERLKGHIVQIKLGEKVKEMEMKVKNAMSMVKVMNINIGHATNNKATIVREALVEVRRNIRQEDVPNLERIIKRTRLVVLGRKTEERQEGGRTVHTVPILFQGQDRKDAEELDRTLRKAGYFPTFHWPGEILEFIGRVRREVRKTTQDRFIRIRPEIVQDTVRIRADTKDKTRSSFVMKGIWMCPPLNRVLWEGVENLYSPQVVGRG